MVVWKLLNHGIYSIYIYIYIVYFILRLHFGLVFVTYVMTWNNISFVVVYPWLYLPHLKTKYRLVSFLQCPDA